MQANTLMNKPTSTLVLTLAALLGACGQGEGPDGPGTPPASVPDSNDSQLGTSGGEDELDEETSTGEEPTADLSEEQDEYVLGLGHIELPDEQPPHEEPCVPEAGFCTEPWEEGDHTCWYAQFSETANTDGVIALQPNSASLWPGAMVRLSEAYDGDLVSIALPRDPLTFSMSLQSLSGDPARTMEEPSLSSFRQLRNDILAAGTSGATPAQIDFSLVTVASSSHFELHVGAEAEWSGGASLNAMFDFNNSAYQNQYLFDFTQTYYTVDADPPARPSSLFADDVEVDELELFMGEDAPPAYVQSVSYGRRVLFGIESNHSLEQISAAINAAIANVGGELDLTAKDTLAASKMAALVLGGNGQYAVQTVGGPEFLMEYLKQGGNFSPDSPGVPIAFKLAYLDNTPAKFSFTAQYAKKVCE